MSLSQTISDKLLDAASNPAPRSVQVRIPASHPVGVRLKKLFDFYATSTVLESGLEIRHRREDPAAVDLIVRELREAVVEAGGDPSALDAIHEAPDPAAHLLNSLGGILSGMGAVS